MPRPTSALLPAALALVGLALAGCSTDGDPIEASGSLRVVGASVAVPPNPTQASVSLTIDNGTDRPDTLLGVSSPASAAASVHRSEIDERGVATMAPVDELVIPARSRVVFEPGGLHVMLDRLAEPLVAGDAVELTLTFAEAGAHTLTVPVVAPGATPNETEHDLHVP